MLVSNSLLRRVAAPRSVRKLSGGGWLTLDPLASFWVPHPFTTLVKGAGVEFDFLTSAYNCDPAFAPHSSNRFPFNHLKNIKKRP